MVPNAVTVSPAPHAQELAGVASPPAATAPASVEPALPGRHAATADRTALAIRAALDRLSTALAGAAAAFVALRAWQVFGFARLDDHARERFGRSGRWLRDLATLGEGLSRSAPLAAALTGADGRRPLGRVAATLIARAARGASLGASSSHADPAHGPLVDKWIDAARRLSVRDLRAALRNARAGPVLESPPDSEPGQSAPPEAAASSSLADADDDPDSDRVLVRLPVPLPILAAFDEALDLHRAIEGRPAMVAEFVEALVGEARASGLPDEAAGLTAGLEPSTPEAQVEAALRRATSAWSTLPPPVAETPLPSLREFRDLAAIAGSGDAAELDRQIRALVAIENLLEARLGEVLATLSDRREWSRLQFAGVGHYAEERLGMSRSRAGERARLARALRAFPTVAAALASGRIAMESAALIHRILEGTRSRTDAAALEAAWVAHASEVTIKRMRDEARAAGRYLARPHSVPAPPSSPLSDAAWRRSIRRAAGTATRRIQEFGRAAAGLDAVGLDSRDLDPAGSDSAGLDPAGLGSTDRDTLGPDPSRPEAGPKPDVFHPHMPEPDVFLRLRLPADLAAGFLAAVTAARDQVEDRVAAVPWDADWPPDPSPSPPPASQWAARAAFVRARRVPLWVGLLALLEDFATTWDMDDAAPDRRDDRIFIRDGWRCAAPGCTSGRHLEDHHIVYRSRGGGDGEGNRITLCCFHHQRGEHGGLMQVRGTAPLDLTWRLGRADLAVTYRNERREDPESAQAPRQSRTLAQGKRYPETDCVVAR